MVTTSKKMVLYIDGNRVASDTWKRLMRIAIRYPDKDWRIMRETDYVDYTVTSHRGILKE